mgnify:CR=1 FL=1
MAEINIPMNLVLIALGLLPSLVWLSLFLTKDTEPEPKYMIIKVFFLGIIIAPVVVLMESGISVISGLDFLPKAVTFFLLAAFVEEYMKYWVVRHSVLTKPDFDQPQDAIIYMIAAALGFAAMENMLVIKGIYSEGVGLASTLGVISLRFTGATLLHALASGLIGYFLGLAWFFYHFKRYIVVFGLVLASVLHFTFNSLIFTDPGPALAFNTLLLLGMLVSVLVLFDRLKTRHKQLIQRLST